MELDKSSDETTKVGTRKWIPLDQKRNTKDEEIARAAILNQMTMTMSTQ